jgi:hypothetical protein
MFESRLGEGQVYQICNFSIIPQSGSYRTTLHPYKILFQSKTQLTSCESCDISDFGFSFVNIAEICAHTRDYEFLVGECCFLWRLLFIYVFILFFWLNDFVICRCDWCYDWYVCGARICKG